MTAPDTTDPHRPHLQAPTLAEAVEAVTTAAKSGYWGGTGQAIRTVLTALRSQAARIAELEEQARLDGEALEQTHMFLVNAPLESGVCCCGDDVSVHGWSHGHAPVDALSYAAASLLESIRTRLASREGGAE